MDVKKTYIKKLIHTTANLSNRRVKTKFNHYKNFFKLLFNVDYFPSNFSYKTAIIIEKEFIEIIKYKNIKDIKLGKALPIKWITKKGLNNNQSDYIPIEPMIYLVPDYETFKEHLINKIENLDSIIFVGNTKYESCLMEIKSDLRNGIIPKAIFIGSKKIDDFSNLKTWEWTIPEINFFNNIESGKLNIIDVGHNEFLEKISNLEKVVNEIDNEFTFDIKKVLRFKKYLYSLIITSEKSRLNTQIEYVKFLLKNKFETEMNNVFYNINEDPNPYIEKISTLIVEIFNNLSFKKFQILLNEPNADILIVPDRFKDIFEDEFKQFPNFRNLKIFTINNFFEMEKKYTQKKNVYLLSIFGYKLIPYDLIKKLLFTSHNINFILYPEEKEIIEKLQDIYENELIREYDSPDRLFLSSIEYQIKPDEKDISEIINEFYSKEDLENKKYDYVPTEAVDYNIEFYNGEKELLEGSKTVLLESNDFKRKEKVSNLMVDDKVRIYENTSKEKLFEIASEEDNEGRLNEVDKYSRLWKSVLKDYFDNKIIEYPNYKEEYLLKELQNNGSRIKLLTLTKWLNPNDRDLFPAQLINLIAIKKTVKNNKIDQHFDSIKKCKSFYRSIMIALGRDLSDEIMDYILSNKKNKGNILERFSDEQIQSFIKESAPLKTIKSIEIIKSELNE